MSEPVPAPSAPTQFPTEKTFTSYNREQGNYYAQNRSDYDRSVYDAVLSHHTSTGGQLDTVLDVGCGPGNAVRALAPHFAHAIGLDPSKGMIDTARSLGGTTSISESIRFEHSTAEQLGENLSPPIPDSSIDLITAANAAHWFDMSGFWPSAARILKPGGTVALWGTGEIRPHPSMPNAAAIHDAMEQLRERHLLPYTEPGSLLSQNRYVDLPLPWTLEEPVLDFDESSFFRRDWGPDETFVANGNAEVKLDKFEKIMATGSAVTRWQQAHPDLVGTEDDITKVFRREIERLLHEAGVEPGKERLRGAALGMLLIVKKKM